MLTTAQVAKRLALSPKTIRKLALAGKIPCYQIATRWRFDEAQIESWLANESRGADQP